MSKIAAQLNDLSAKNTCLRQDFLSVTSRFATEKPFQIFKLVEKTAQWPLLLDMCPAGQEDLFIEIRDTAKLAKLARWPGKLVSAFDALRHKVIDLYEKPSMHNATQVFRKSLGLFGPVWDGIDFFSRAIIHWSKDTFRTFRGANGIALTISFAWSALESMATIASSSLYHAKTLLESQVEQEKVLKACMSLAREISFVALGIMIVLSALFGVAVPAIAFCTASTSTVVFTTMKFYYTNLGQEIPHKA